MGERGVPLAAAAGALLHTTQLTSPTSSGMTCLPGGLRASSDMFAGVSAGVCSGQQIRGHT